MDTGTDSTMMAAVATRCACGQAQRARRGRLTVIDGPMFSGKTLQLITLVNTRVRCGARALVLTARMACRPGDLTTSVTQPAHCALKSRDGHVALCDTRPIATDALYAYCADTIAQRGGDGNGGGDDHHHHHDESPPFDVVAIDEAQFFERLVDTCRLLRAAGVDVYVSGLSLTYTREPFGEMWDVQRYADERFYLTAVCDHCRTPTATVTHRRPLPSGDAGGNGGGVVLIGSADAYVPLCQSCYDTATAPQQ